MTILLDPWTLTWSDATLDASGAEEYVERLTELYDLSLEECVPFAITEEAAELLSVDNMYPLASGVPDLLWPNRADVYRLVAALLDKLPKLSRTGVMAVLVDDVSRVPEIYYHVSEGHLAHLDELASLSLIVPERSGIASPQLVSSRATLESIHQYSICIKDVECVGAPPARLGIYEGEVFFRPSVALCLSEWSCAELLVKGFVEQAIALGIWQRSRAVNGGPFLVDGWKLGNDFTASIGTSGVAATIGRADALVRACVDLVSGNNLRATHWLRKSSAGGAAQRKRSSDSAGAWRADIDYEYHVHYWMTGNGIEFANVVTHNCFDITS